MLSYKILPPSLGGHPILKEKAETHKFKVICVTSRSVLFSSFSPGLSSTVSGTENDFRNNLLNEVPTWGCHDSNLDLFHFKARAFPLKPGHLAWTFIWVEG